MREIAKFTVGSSVFFGGYSDYISKDIDALVFADKIIGKGNILRLTPLEGKDDVFYCKDIPKQELIGLTLKIGLPMGAGKFLVPEVAEYLKLTVEDLKQLEPLFSSLDAKHSYEKLIYEAYLHNNAFVLTDKQRDAAYREYRRTRGYKT